MTIFRPHHGRRERCLPMSCQSSDLSIGNPSSSPRVGRACVGRILQDIRYHGTRDGGGVGDSVLIAYLTCLAGERRMTRSKQMKTLSVPA